MPDEFSCISYDEYKFLISIGQIYQGYVMDDDGTLMFSVCNILMCLPEFWDIDNPPHQAPQGEDTVESVNVCALLVPDKKPVMPSTSEIMNYIYRRNADKSQTVNFPDGRMVNLPPEPDGHVYLNLSDSTDLDSTHFYKEMRISIQTTNKQTGETQSYNDTLKIGQIYDMLNLPVATCDIDTVQIRNNIMRDIANTPAYGIINNVNNGIGGAGMGMQQLEGKTFRLIKNGRFSPKMYNSGWQGGSRARITTYGFGKVGRIISRGATGVTIFLGVIDIGTAIYEDGGVGKNTAQAAGRVAGGWAGAMAGGKLGIIFGTLYFPPPFGTIIGGAVGAFFGGIAGTKIGEKIVKWFDDLF